MVGLSLDPDKPKFGQVAWCGTRFSSLVFWFSSSFSKEDPSVRSLLVFGVGIGRVSAYLCGSVFQQFHLTLIKL